MGKFNGMTRAEALIEMADRYTTVAIGYLRRGENELARFYKNAADGFLKRLDSLSVAECCEVL